MINSKMHTTRVIIGVIAVSFVTAVAGCPRVNLPEEHEEVRFKVLAINDFHGALYETPLPHSDSEMVIGGFPWLVGAVKQIREEQQNVLLFDGGDLFQGSWPVNSTNGRGSIEAFNMLGVDAAVVGNHDFDYGPLPIAPDNLRGSLEAAAAEARFSWLSANLTRVVGDSETPWTPAGVQPWTVIEKSGVRFGIIGVTTQDTPETTLAKNVADLRFKRPVDTIKGLLPRLEAAGVDVTVVVGHMTGSCEPLSYTEPPASDCRPDGEIGEILDELPPGTVDIIVAGHAHSVLANRIDDTFVLQNRSKGHLIGDLDLFASPANGVNLEQSVINPPRAIIHPPSEPGCEGGLYNTSAFEISGQMVSPDLSAVSLVRALEAEAGSLCDPVACADHRIMRSRKEESPLGNLIADTIRSAFKGVDVAIQNSGGLRADLTAGIVRREDIHAVSPFQNRLLLIEMNGDELRRLLQIGSSGAHGILQVSGASYHFDDAITEGVDIDADGSIDTWEQDRLCALSVAGTPVTGDKKYRVVVTDFLYGGGDHLGPAFEGVDILEEGPLLRDHLTTAFGRKQSCLDKSPLLDQEWPRVKIGPCQ